MNKLLKQVLLVSGCLFALTGHAMLESPAISVESAAGSLLDAERAYAEGNFAKQKRYTGLWQNRAMMRHNLYLGPCMTSGWVLLRITRQQ